MSWNLFCSKVDPVSFKNVFSYDEYVNIKKACSMINSTSLYNVYRSMTTDPLSYQEFYANLRNRFYYDRYVCAHGTEFMYYVKFKDVDVSSKEPTDVVEIVRAIQ